MIRILILLVTLCGLGFAESETKALEPPIVSLFVVHDKIPNGGSEVSTPSKSSKGFVTSKPDLEFLSFLDVVHLVPKVLKQTSKGQAIFVDGDADLLLNLHAPESKKLEALRQKVGEARLYVRVTAGKDSRYFDAEFAPVSDDTIFVEGTAGEKRELANLLRKLITEKAKGEQVSGGNGG